jgi:type IV pilus assembly protein PilE
MQTFVSRKSLQARRQQSGFTLIELMVVATIIAILAGIALPSYRTHVIRANRSAAQAEMMSLANREQQFLIANRTFADTAALTANGYALPPEIASFYDWDVTIASDPLPVFTITLTPTASQAKDGALTLDSRGNKTPAAKWQK